MPLADGAIPSQMTICAGSLPATTVGTLATYLSHQTHLTHLCIECTALPEAGVETLLTALTVATAQRSPLTHVRLADVGLSTKGAVALAPLLSHGLGGLQSLDLSNNRANFRGSQALQQAADARPSHSAPLTLDLSGNLVTVELLNACTHGVAAAIALVAGALLTWQAARKPLRRAIVGSIGIFCTSLFTLFASSCAYHSLFRRPRLHALLRRADHCSIFLLIAGSYTPFVATYTLQPPTVSGALTLAAVWACAAAGIARSVVGAGSNRGRAFFALATGWMGLISIRTMMERMPSGALFGVVVGGIIYSIGLVFYLLGKKKPILHVVWHFAVMLGGSFHYTALSKYVVNARG